MINHIRLPVGPENIEYLRMGYLIMAEKMVVTALPMFMNEARVGKVLVGVGDQIEKDQAVLTLETSKGSMELRSTVSGTVSAVLLSDGDTVKVGDLLLETEQAVAEEITVVSPGMPGFQATAKIGSLRVKKGDAVSEGDVLVVLEGGKGTAEVKAPAAGIVKKILVSEGDQVEKDAQILVLALSACERETEVCSAKPEKAYYGEVVVLGGGPGGYVAAIRASQRGKKTILIEADKLGGTGLNRGCIPTKSMVESTRVMDAVKEAGLFGMMDADCTVNMGKVMDRKNQVVGTLVSGLDASMERHGITVLRGKGSARDEKTLEVDLPTETAMVRFDDLILAPGSVVSYPPFPGADLPDNLTSDDLLELREIPESMIILGGRVIAMEFAFIYQKLGTKVTVIQRSDSIFPNMDQDVIDEVHASAEAFGITFYEGTKIQAIRNTADGRKLVEFQHRGETLYLTADKLAVATGRKPNLEGLHLDRLHVEISEKTHGIQVDSRMKTTASHIYAIGDATHLYDLAHAASRQGLVAVENIMGNPVEMRYDAIPEAVFTDPEIGLCGMSEKACAKAGLEVLVGKFPYASNGKALVENATKGFIKVIARKSDRVIVGAALVGISAADLLSTFTNLITMGVTIDQAKDVIYAHPTVSETLSEALMDLDGESLHK